jgi:uncharacterized membrane protein
LVSRIGGSVLWANLGLLFFLSLLPFTTEWMDHTRLARTPLVVYGINLLLIAGAYFVLQTLVIRQEGVGSPLREAVAGDVRGRISPLLYLVGIISAAVLDDPGQAGAWLALGCYVAVAVILVIPNRRVDRVVREHGVSD